MKNVSKNMVNTHSTVPSVEFTAPSRPKRRRDNFVLQTENLSLNLLSWDEFPQNCIN